MLITSTNNNEIVKAISNHVNGNAALISVGEHTEVDINALILDLNQAGVTFMGGIFPKVIHGNSILDKGFVINTLSNVESLYVIENINTLVFAM